MLESKVGNFFRTLILYKLLGRKPPDPSAEPEPPKTWKERLTYVADNAKGDKDAPSYFKGYFRGYLASACTRAILNKNWWSRMPNS